MNKKKCPKCGSAKTKKNGQRNGVQLYKCTECGYQFRGGTQVSMDELWEAYLNGKQTIKELAAKYKISASSIKRRLRKITKIWLQPDLTGMSGFVHLDATYWGHSWGILLALDHETNMPLYVAFIKSETTLDYRRAISAVEAAGYKIKGIIVDGKQALFKEFEKYPVQMCQFHMYQIIERRLTKHPKLIASRDLAMLVDDMELLDKEDFMNDYNAWKTQWNDFVNKRTIHKDGKTYYLHRRLRSAVTSLDYYLPYLYTYQRPECNGMPNTNNKIEGTFTDLKKNLNNHSGMSIENRMRFISGYFTDRLLRII